MFLKIKAGLKQTVLTSLLFLAGTVVLSLIFHTTAWAAPLQSKGPSVGDLGARYIVSNERAYKNTSDHLVLYFPKTTPNPVNSTKNVQIVGGNLCLGPQNTRANDRDTATDPAGGAPGPVQNGQPATFYQAFDQSQGGTALNGGTHGRGSNSGTCKTDAINYSINVPASSYRASIKMYAIGFNATLEDPAKSDGVKNEFYIQLGAGDKVGYNGSRTFGIATDTPQINNVLHNYSFPFAQACNGSATQGTLVIYDPDVGNPSIQPQPFQVSVHDETTNSNISLNNWSSTNGSGKLIQQGNNVYDVNGNSLVTITVTLNLNNTDKYDFNVNRIYWVNLLQFQIPFDSIEHDVTCPNWNLQGNSFESGSYNNYTFSHNVQNLPGSTSATYDWRVWEKKANSNTYTPTGGTSWSNGTATSNNAPNYDPIRATTTNNYSFPAGTAPGSTYCQRIDYQYASGPGTAGGQSQAKCITYNPPPPSGNVSGSIFKVDRNGNRVPAPSVTVYNCSGNQTTTTDPNGQYAFTVPANAAFCVRVLSGPPAGYMGQYDRPWGSGAQQGYRYNPPSAAECGPYQGNYNSPWPQYCAGQTSYEWQWASRYSPPKINAGCANGTGSGTCASYDRNWDGGYDFVYTPVPPVGNTDSAQCGPAGLNGWAYAPHLPGNSIQVDVYEGGPAGGGGAFKARLTANVPRGDVNLAFGIPGDHGFHMDLSGYEDGNNHKFYLYALGEDMNGALDGDNPQIGSSPITMAGCKQFNYNPAPYYLLTGGSSENPTQIVFGNIPNLTIVPSPPPNQVCGSDVQYSVTKKSVGGGITTLAGPATDGPRCIPVGENKQYLTYNVPPGTISAGDKFCIDVTVSPGSGLVDMSGNQIPGSAGAGKSAESCLIVHNEPYIHVFGSDAFAGGGFGNGCTTANGGINTYLSTTGLHPVGSGVQIGALAIGPINGFSSAILRGSTPKGSSDLTFANSTVGAVSGPGAPALGGSLGGTFCSPDYFTTAMPAGLTSSTVNIISGNRPNATGARQSSTEYYTPTGGTLTIIGGSIDDYTNVAIFVKGNVHITGGGNAIKYTNNVWTGNNDAIEKIPSFQLFVTGNIYIDPGITQLDGLYIAQPDAGGVGGNIYTCSNAAGTGGLDVNSDLLASCHNQLVINGAFVAQKVYLERSFGSLRDSYAGEQLNGTRPATSPDCGIDSGPAPLGDCSAEIFNFSPELYLAQPATKAQSGPTTGKYDYFTSLPPVL